MHCYITNLECFISSIPRNENRKRLWLEAIGTENIRPDIFVCSPHFDESAINNTLANKRLRDDAVPTLLIKMTQDDGKPEQICTECILNLKIAYKFKTDCIQSEKAFQPIVLMGFIGIKKEPTAVSGHSSLLDEDFKKLKAEVKRECLSFEESELTRNDDNSIKLEKKKEGRPCKQKVNVKATITKPQCSKKKETKLQKDKKEMKIILECTICQIQFKTQKELSKHKKGRHKKTWICELCGKEMKSSKELHLKFHQPPQYQCDNCPYKAYYKYDLSKHMQIHLGKKSYICDKCPNVAYHSHSNLRAHIRNIHLKERNYQCDICGKEYFAKYSLKRHVESHTEIKRHSCHICKKLYTRRQAWKEHLLNEHGVTLPRGKPGPKLKYDKESALKQQITMNSAIDDLNNYSNVNIEVK